MNVMIVLVLVVVASGVAGLGRSRHMLWAVTGVFGLVLVAFVGLAAYARFLTKPARRSPRKSVGRAARNRYGPESRHGAGDPYGDQRGVYPAEADPYGGEADPYSGAVGAYESEGDAGWYHDDRPVALWDDEDRNDGNASTQPDEALWAEDGEIWDEQARTEQILYHFDDVRGRDDDTDGWEPIAAAR